MSTAPGAAAAPSRGLLLAFALAAIALFVPLFVTGGAGRFDFWWWMALNNVLLVGAALRLDPSFAPALRRDLGQRALRKVALGLASAALLYGVFFAGDHVARAIIPQAGRGIEAIYALREGTSVWRVALLMAVVFGPGEELLWRGLLQRGATHALGRSAGLVAATGLYAAVHLGSGNLMLVLAAAVCGLYWGVLYLWTGSLLINVVSHTVWDLVVFLLLPLRA